MKRAPNDGSIAKPRSKLRLWLHRAILAGFGLGLCALSVEQWFELRDRRLVLGHSFAEVSGRSIRYVKLNSPRKGPQPAPTVVFLNGINDVLEQWGDIGRALSPTAHVVTFDRSGMGYSDTVLWGQSRSEAKAEVTDLLQALDLDQPLILVAFSSSALLARELLGQPDQPFDGVFFLDPSMPEALAKEGAEVAARRMTKTQARLLLEVGKTMSGYTRLKSWLRPETGPVFGRTPKEQEVKLRTQYQTPHWIACFHLAYEWGHETEASLEPGRLGDLPLAVATTASSGVHLEAHQALAKVSRNGYLIDLSALPHISLVHENHERVSAEILAFLSRIPSSPPSTLAN